jgi:hypothetical protein
VVALLLRERRMRGVLIGLGTGMATLIAVALLVPGTADLPASVLAQATYSEDSLHTLLINGALAAFKRFDYDRAFAIDRAIAVVVCGGWIARRFASVRDPSSMVNELGKVLLILLIGYAVSVHPWYLTWLLPIAALMVVAPLRRLILVTATAGLALYAVPYELIEGPSGHVGWAATRLGMAFVVPLAYWPLDIFMARWRAPMKRDVLSELIVEDLSSAPGAELT